MRIASDIDQDLKKTRLQIPPSTWENPETPSAYALFIAKNIRQHQQWPARRACARRAGANKSLSNCSLKNPVAPSRDGARQRPAALKPAFDVLYFAQLAGRPGQPERADCARRAQRFVY